jgi:hypothetical protein
MGHISVRKSTLCMGGGLMCHRNFILSFQAITWISINIEGLFKGKNRHWNKLMFLVRFAFLSLKLRNTSTFVNKMSHMGWSIVMCHILFEFPLKMRVIFGSICWVWLWILHLYIVKPVYNDHPWDLKMVVVINRWLLAQVWLY